MGEVQTVPVTVSQQSQYYFDVNNAYNHPISSGCGCTPTNSVSAEVYSNTPSIVAKRLMYFHYGSSRISGGTDVVGEAGPSSHAVYTFAEGYTFGNFREFLTLQNPNSTVEFSSDYVICGITRSFRRCCNYNHIAAQLLA